MLKIKTIIWGMTENIMAIRKNQDAKQNAKKRKKGKKKKMNKKLNKQT